MRKHKIKELPETLVQKCLGAECPFLENHKICMHKLEIEEDSICMIEYQNKAHSHEEIAKILGISKQSVIYLEKKALEKIKMSMLSNLKKEGLTEYDLFD